jgi:hypothetical protein
MFCKKDNDNNNVYPKTNNNQNLIKSHTTGEYIPGEDPTRWLLLERILGVLFV